MIYVKEILCTGKYLPYFYISPFCPRCHRANFRLGNLQYPKFSLLYHNFVWANLRRGETVCKCISAKITEGEHIILHTVSGYNLPPKDTFCLQSALWGHLGYPQSVGIEEQLNPLGHCVNYKKET